MITDSRATAGQMGAGLAKSLARRPGAIVFSSRATKMYHCPARRATSLQVLKNS